MLIKILQHKPSINSILYIELKYKGLFIGAHKTVIKLAVKAPIECPSKSCCCEIIWSL